MSEHRKEELSEVSKCLTERKFYSVAKHTDLGRKKKGKRSFEGRTIRKWRQVLGS